MDFNQNEQNDYYNQPTHKPYDSGFATASMVFGILSITLGCCIFSFPLGALGILFALLCYRRGKKLDPNCKLGLILSIVGIAAQVFFTVYVIYAMFSSPQFMDQLNQTTQSLYGMDFSEMLQYYYGQSIQQEVML